MHELKSLNGHTLTCVDNFKYIGVHVPNSAYDFDKRKALAWSAINKLDRIWKSDLNKGLKMSLFRACIESILLYNSETWTITQAMKTKIDGLYTKLPRRALNISWRDHVSNDDMMIYHHSPQPFNNVA